MLISKLLAFPEDFFYGDDLPKISEHTASFRSMSKMSATLKESALGAGSLAFVLNGWIESRFNLPVADLPDLSDLSPEDAAATLRRIWGLGEAPISNMIHLLESKGVRVYSLAIEARAERVNDFATPCFINLLCRVVLFQSVSFPLAVG